MCFCAGAEGSRLPVCFCIEIHIEMTQAVNFSIFFSLLDGAWFYSCGRHVGMLHFPGAGLQWWLSFSLQSRCGL